MTMGRKKTTAEFEEELSRAAKGIGIIGEFNGVNEPIQVRCETCGYTWAPVARSLIYEQQGACPKCSRATRVRCVETGEVYPSIHAAASAITKARPSSISECLRGKRKTAGGYHWEYVDEKKAKKAKKQ